MNVQVRQATNGDIEIVARILTQAAHYKIETHNDISWKNLVSGSYDFLPTEVTPDIARGNTYVALLNDKIVGTVALQWEDELIWGKQPADAVYIHRLAIADTHRGQNLGSQIIDWTAEQARSKGRQYLRLDSHPSNKGLRKYYEKLGFVHVGLRKVKEPRMQYTTSLFEKKV